MVIQFKKKNIKGDWSYFYWKNWYYERFYKLTSIYHHYNCKAQIAIVEKKSIL